MSKLGRKTIIAQTLHKANLNTAKELRDKARKYRLQATAIAEYARAKPYRDRAEELEAEANKLENELHRLAHENTSQQHTELKTSYPQPKQQPTQQPKEDPAIANCPAKNDFDNGLFDKCVFTCTCGAHIKFVLPDRFKTSPEAAAEAPATEEQATAIKRTTIDLDSVPTQAKIHRDLAIAIMAYKRTEGHHITRSYALWCVMRSYAEQQNLSVFDKGELIEFAMDRTGKAQSTVYNWINMGEGVFWNTGTKNRVFLVGKDKVFDHFLGANIRPGKLCFVGIEYLLNERLHVVNAAISASWHLLDSPKPIARKTRREAIQGIPERTQLEYDRTNGTKAIPSGMSVNGQRYQRPNLYVRSCQVSTRQQSRIDKNEFYDYRVTDNNMAISIVTNGDHEHKRIHFFDPAKAVYVAKHRQQKEDSTPVYCLLNNSHGRYYNVRQFN